MARDQKALFDQDDGTKFTPVFIGVSPAGVEWVAYKPEQVEPMKARLAALKAKAGKKAKAAKKAVKKAAKKVARKVSKLKADQKKTLQALRNRTKARPDRGRKGLAYLDGKLIYRSRYEDSAKEVAQLVRQLPGAKVESVSKHGTMGRDLSERPWRVAFTISPEADDYLRGKTTLGKVQLKSP